MRKRQVSDSWNSEVDTSMRTAIGTQSDLDMSFKYDKISTSLMKDFMYIMVSIIRNAIEKFRNLNRLLTNEIQQYYFH